MSDLISRKKAFEYFVTLWECIGTIMDRDEWEDVCMTTANEIPSADIPHSDWEKYSDRLWHNAYERGKADRPQGEWEIVAQGWHSLRRCSNCKWTQTYSDPKYMGYEYNYCPNCGSRNRKENE